LHFDLITTDPNTQARRGRITTAHGEISTPVFMPVGTAGTVKAITQQELKTLGAEIILGNTYHLYLRPGHQLIHELGGLHRFISWDRPMLTDSGGFQVFSHSELRRISEDGVAFRSHLDGSPHFLSPEKAVEIQQALGADIIMAFDHVVALPAPLEQVRDAAKRTSLWARRCLSARRRLDQSLFGIVQGGLDRQLRVESARDIRSIGFDGYAVGGLSVGEEKADMYAMLDVTVPELPSAKPRYLMGVGMPEDLVEGVARGIDMFDCVVPSRHGRTGWLFTSFGRVVIKQARYARDEQPIDPDCRCPVCTRYTRAYLHHLFMIKEMLGARLNTIHNLWFFSELMRQIRAAIGGGTFQEFRRRFHQTYVVDRPAGEARNDARKSDVS